VVYEISRQVCRKNRRKDRIDHGQRKVHFQQLYARDEAYLSDRSISDYKTSRAHQQVNTDR
jgi:hypothetical protein